MNTNEMTLNSKVMDEAFLDRLASIGSLDEALKILKDEGIEMTREELAENMDAGEQLLQESGVLTEDGELSEEALEAVAGGRNWKLILLGAVILGVSAWWAIPEGILVGAALVYLGWKSK